MLSSQEIDTRRRALEQQIYDRMSAEIEWRDQTIHVETTDSFQDIHGYTLIEYAAMQGRVDEVRERLENEEHGVSLASIAMELGNEELVKLLEEYNIHYDLMNAGQKVVTDNKQSLYILAKRARSKLDEMMAKANQATKLSKQARRLKMRAQRDVFQGQDSGWHYLAYMNPLAWRDFPVSEMQEPFKQIDLNKENTKGYRPLELAIIAGNEPAVRKLLEYGASLDFQTKTLHFSPLALALFYGRADIAKVLKAKGASIAPCSNREYGLLSCAIVGGDSACVDLVLQWAKDEPQLLIEKDIMGNTPMHFAAHQDKPDIYSLLLHHKELRDQIASKNIETETPIEAAHRAGNHNFIQLLERLDPNLIKDVKRKVEVSQLDVIRPLRYYLALMNANPNKISEGGICNGLSFVYLIYSAEGRQEEFFDLLAAVVSWDGQMASLARTPEGFDAPLADLMRQLANDVIWFQATELDPELEELNPEQLARKEQYELVKQRGAKLSAETSASFMKDSFTEAQLAELFTIFRKVNGAKIDIGGAGHATVAFVDDAKIGYYDPNITFKLPDFTDMNELARFVYIVKYQAADSNNDNHTMPLSYISYVSDKLDYKSFRYFDELPSTKKAHEEYHKQSSNKFTPLHVAVVTGSALDVKSLCQQKDILVNQKDRFGMTAFDWAIQLGKNEIAEVIMARKDLILTHHKPLETAYSYANNHMLDKLLQIKGIDIKRTIYLIATKGDCEALQKIIKSGNSIKSSGASMLKDVVIAAGQTGAKIDTKKFCRLVLEQEPEINDSRQADLLLSALILPEVGTMVAKDFKSIVPQWVAAYDGNALHTLLNESGNNDELIACIIDSAPQLLVQGAGFANESPIELLIQQDKVELLSQALGTAEGKQWLKDNGAQALRALFLQNRLNVAMAAVLIERGAALDELRALNPVHKAARTPGARVLINHLCNAKFDVDAKDELGRTPAQYALEEGIEENLHALANLGASIDDAEVEEQFGKPLVFSQKPISHDWSPKPTKK